MRCGTKVDALGDMVCTPLRETLTVGSCTIRRDKCDVDQDAGSMDVK